jgi:hypothetical protein
MKARLLVWMSLRKGEVEEVTYESQLVRYTLSFLVTLIKIV